MPAPIESARRETRMHPMSPQFNNFRSNPMKYYSVAEIEITDQSWVPAYVKNVTGLVELVGGEEASVT
jgi:hypothetical protein